MTEGPSTLGQGCDVTRPARWLRWRHRGVQVRFIGEIEKEADIGLSGIACAERAQTETDFDKSQDRGGIDVSMVDIMWPRKRGDDEIGQPETGIDEIAGWSCSPNITRIGQPENGRDAIW